MQVPERDVSIRELKEFMAHMRSSEGCPWDREQDFSTIRKTFESEFQEALDALEKEDWENFREELGDLFWNIIFLSELAREKGHFDLEDVVAEMQEKIIRRHPHVFGDKKLDTFEEVRKEYLKIKEEEKKSKDC